MLALFGCVFWLLRGGCSGTTPKLLPHPLAKSFNSGFYVLLLTPSPASHNLRILQSFVSVQRPFFPLEINTHSHFSISGACPRPRAIYYCFRRSRLENTLPGPSCRTSTRLALSLYSHLCNSDNHLHNTNNLGVCLKTT